MSAIAAGLSRSTVQALQLLERYAGELGMTVLEFVVALGAR
jgi:hypothetical protein